MRLFVLFITVIYATFLSAQVYKWVDENGKTHYSDKPHSEKYEDKINPAFSKTK